MWKFFTVATFALAVCAVDVAAASYQAASVRRAPASDEKPATDKQTGRPATQEEQIPVVASSTPLAAPINPSSASDAPAKLNPAPLMSAPEKNDGAETGNSSSPAKAPSANSSGLASASAGATSAAAPLTSVYRIGIGDVLDIRLLNLTDTRQSTLFTVLAGGVIDYPLLPDPVPVYGLTTDELAAQLMAGLKHRGIYDKPQARVNVRDYASHAVLVSGLVEIPGTKILRREAVPLYVVVAEAQPKPEAGRAIVISHATGKSANIDLNDAAAMSIQVQQGDVVNIVARPPEFFYIGGEINAPGQKDFHPGMTLTQAVLASGGMTRYSRGRLKVSRQGSDGRLVSIEYTMQEITDGVVPDPRLQAGDRIEVARVKK